MDTKKVFGAVLGLLLWVGIALTAPPAGLTQHSMIVLGSLAWAILWWVFKVIPDFITGLLMCISWVLFGVSNFGAAFAQVSGANWWLILSGLGLGFACNKCGLLRRTALSVMKLFPGNFLGMNLGILASGIIISPLIPSGIARTILAAPIALLISDTMRYKHNSKASSALFISMFNGFCGSQTMFLSAATICYASKALLPEAIQSDLTWTQWFLLALPWGIVWFIGTVLTTYFILRPKEDNRLPAGFIEQQLQEMGPLSRHEKIAAVIMVTTFSLWVLEKVSGIPAACTAVIALSLMIIFGVMNVKDFRTGIPWESIIYIAMVLNLSQILPKVGINEWVTAFLGPYVKPLMSNQVLMIVGLIMIIYLTRFIIASVMAGTTVLMLIILPFFLESGINPVILPIIVVGSVNIWVLKYQNPPVITAESAVDNKMLDDKYLMLSSLAYMVINLLGFLLSLPYWNVMGIL